MVQVIWVRDETKTAWLNKVKYNADITGNHLFVMV